MTNSHVIAGGRKIQVKLLESEATLQERRDGRTFNAKVVGVDRDTDLALLKIERTGLRALPFANSGELRQGQLVMAFGNPLWPGKHGHAGSRQFNRPAVEAR